MDTFAMEVSSPPRSPPPSHPWDEARLAIPGCPARYSSPLLQACHTDLRQLLARPIAAWCPIVDALRQGLR